MDGPTCPHCNARVSKVSRFCSACGNVQPSASSGSKPAGPPHRTPASPPAGGAAPTRPTSGSNPAAVAATAAPPQQRRPLSGTHPATAPPNRRPVSPSAAPPRAPAASSGSNAAAAAAGPPHRRPLSPSAATKSPPQRPAPRASPVVKKGAHVKRSAGKARPNPNMVSPKRPPSPKKQARKAVGARVKPKPAPSDEQERGAPVGKARASPKKVASPRKAETNGSAARPSSPVLPSEGGDGAPVEASPPVEEEQGKDEQSLVSSSQSSPPPLPVAPSHAKEGEAAPGPLSRGGQLQSSLLARTFSSRSKRISVIAALIDSTAIGVHQKNELIAPWVHSSRGLPPAMAGHDASDSAATRSPASLAAGKSLAQASSKQRKSLFRTVRRMLVRPSATHSLQLNARALASCASKSEDELGFQRGDILTIVRFEEDHGRWIAYADGRVGVVSLNRLEIIAYQRPSYAAFEAFVLNVGAKSIAPMGKLALKVTVGRLPSEDREHAMECFIKLAAHYHFAESLIFDKIREEIATVKESQSGSLFRGNDFNSILVAAYASFLVRDYLPRVLGELIENVVDVTNPTDYEVDPRLVEPVEGLTKEEVLQRNCFNLRQLCTTFICKVVNSLSSAPLPLRRFCHLIRTTVDEKWPGHGLRMIGSLFFLRIVCPALVTPDRWRTLVVTESKDLLPANVRILLLVSKVLQGLVNRRMFVAGSMLEPLNDFVTQSSPLVEDFLDHVSQLPSRDQLGSVRVTREYTDVAAALEYFDDLTKDTLRYHMDTRLDNVSRASILGTLHLTVSLMLPAMRAIVIRSGDSGDRLTFAHLVRTLTRMGPPASHKILFELDLRVPKVNRFDGMPCTLTHLLMGMDDVPTTSSLDEEDDMDALEDDWAQEEDASMIDSSYDDAFEGDEDVGMDGGDGAEEARVRFGPLVRKQRAQRPSQPINVPSSGNRKGKRDVDAPSDGGDASDTVKAKAAPRSAESAMLMRKSGPKDNGSAGETSSSAPATLTSTKVDAPTSPPQSSSRAAAGGRRRPPPLPAQRSTAPAATSAAAASASEDQDRHPNRIREQLLMSELGAILHAHPRGVDRNRRQSMRAVQRRSVLEMGMSHTDFSQVEWLLWEQLLTARLDEQQKRIRHLEAETQLLRCQHVRLRSQLSAALEQDASSPLSSPSVGSKVAGVKSKAAMEKRRAVGLGKGRGAVARMQATQHQHLSSGPEQDATAVASIDSGGISVGDMAASPLRRGSGAMVDNLDGPGGKGGKGGTGSGSGSGGGSLRGRLDSTHTPLTGARRKFWKSGSKRVKLDTSQVVVREQLAMGGGSFCKIFVADLMGWQCICKELDYEFVSGLVGGEASVEAFEREVSFLESMPPHPNIVQYLHHDTFKGKLRLFIRRYACTLGTYLNEFSKTNSGPLAPSTVRVLCLQMANGLAFLRKHDIVHRDLKAENVFLSFDRHGSIGDVAIGDFDTAKRLAPRETTKSMVGTPGYVAPEVWSKSLRSQGYDHSVDVYSLGVILVEIMTLGFPFGEDNGTRVQLRAETGEVPPELLSPALANFAPVTAIARRCLSPDPNARPSPKDIAQLVQGYMGTIMAQ